MKRVLLIPAAAMVLFLASCGGSNESNDNSTATDTSTPAAPAVEAPGADIPGIDTVTVSDHIKLDGMDDMKYDRTLFKVKAGQKVTLGKIANHNISSVGFLMNHSKVKPTRWKGN